MLQLGKAPAKTSTVVELIADLFWSLDDLLAAPVEIGEEDGVQNRRLVKW